MPARLTTSVIAVLALIGGGAVLGWHLHPDPAPGVDLAVAYRAASSWRARSTTVTVAGPERVVEGPVRVVERWRTVAGPTPPPAPGCAPCPACEEHERIEERGPVTTDRGPTSTTSTAEAQGASSSQGTEVLHVVPAPRPSWAVGAGLQLLPDRRLEVALEHRVAGPLWARAWLLQPAELAMPAVGLGLRGEW